MKILVRTLQGYATAAVMVFAAQVVLSTDCMPEERGRLSDLEYDLWKTHVFALLDTSSDLTPNSRSVAERQYHSAAMIDRSPLLDYCMAVIMFQHGEYPAAHKFAEAAWNASAMWSVEAAELIAILTLKQERDQSRNMRLLVERLLKRMGEANTSEEIRCDTARLAGRIIRMLLDTHTAMDDLEQWRLCNEQARALPNSRTIEAYDEGFRAAEELLKTAASAPSEKDMQVEKELSQRLQKFSAQGKMARKIAADIEAGQKMSRRNLESQIVRIDAGLQACDQRFRVVYPQWEQLSTVTHALRAGAAYAGQHGTVVLGRKYSRAQASAAAAEAGSQLAQAEAELQLIVTSANELLAARAAVLNEYSAVAGRELFMKQDVNLWSERVQNQKAALSRRMNGLTSSELGTTSKTRLLLPFDPIATVSTLRNNLNSQ